MDFFPLINSIRISFISMLITLVFSIFIANKIVRQNRIVRAIVDILLTLPLILPPTVVGYIAIKLTSRNSIVGSFFIKYFNIKLTMNWWSAIFVTSIVILPLMYRTIRSSFESYDKNYDDYAKDLGANDFYAFWNVKIPICKSGIIAAVVLAFARGIGEYGATSMICGYIPKKTATIATTVYNYWSINDDKMALFWVTVNVAISMIVLILVNFFEKIASK